MEEGYVYINRHGESLATRDQSVYGRMNPLSVPCTLWGHEQSQDDGKYINTECETNPLLKDKKIHVFYIDAPKRIRQSKNAVIDNIDPKYIASVNDEPLIREREHGKFDGLSEKQQKELDLQKFEALHSSDYYLQYTTKMPDGESLKDVEERLRKFIEDKVKPIIKSGDHVLVITHGDNCQELEDILTHYETSYVAPAKHIPGTGDIIRVKTDFEKPGIAETVHKGKQRPTHLPHYKAEEYIEEKLGRKI